MHKPVRATSTTPRAVQLSASDRELAARCVRRLFPDPAVRLVLFGSRARGSAMPHSDIDLALCGNKALPPDRLAELRESLEDSLLPFRVDVVDYMTAPAGLREAIDREGVEWDA